MCHSTQSSISVATVNIHVQIFVWTYTSISINILERKVWVVCRYMFNFLRHCPTVLQSGSIILHSPAIVECCSCSISSPTLDMISLFNCSHSTCHAEVFDGGFNWCFPNN